MTAMTRSGPDLGTTLSRKNFQWFFVNAAVRQNRSCWFFVCRICRVKRDRRGSERSRDLLRSKVFHAVCSASQLASQPAK